MQSRNSLTTTIVLVSVVLLTASGWLVAQTSFGSVNGTVTDATKGVIPGAAVTLTNTATNIKVETVTNDNGFFRIVNVRPGNYTLSISLVGFKTSSLPAFDVDVNAAVTKNASLQVGDIAETVEIVGGADLIQASSAELGNVIEQEVIKDLPLNGRNFTQLLILTPGANPVSTAQGSQTTVNFGAAEGNTGLPGSVIANASVQGQQNRSKVYYLDGIINTSVRGTSYVVLPDIDSLQEFKVQSHNDKAEYGGVTGGVVNMTSKSGTNEWHGSAFEFVRNEMFDARDPFRDRDKDKPLVFRQNQFGANVGGPIIKNKTFFFAGYDGWRYRDVANFQRLVPTETELNGDLSQHANAARRKIYNPFTYRIVDGKEIVDEFPNNKIPANMISPMMQGFLKAYMYKPNRVPDASNSNNFLLQRARENNANGLQVRIDHHLGDSDNAFFRWNEQKVTTFNPQGDLGYKTPEATNRNLGGGYLHSFSPSLIMEVRGGVATQPTEDAPLEHPLGSEPQKQLGFPALDKYEGYVVSLGDPWMGDQLGTQGARPRGNPNWNIATDLTWLRGNHGFKTGFQFVHIARLQKNRFGEIRFDKEPTENPQSVGTSGDTLASALLSLPYNIRAYVHDFGSIDFGTGTASVYFQDEWKMRPDLALTLGLRYDYVTRATSNDPTVLQSGPDMNTGNWLIALEQAPSVCAADGSTPPPCFAIPFEQIPLHERIIITGERSSIIRPIKDNFGPRVGLAWQINPKTALRTGYSLMWDALPSRSQYAQHQYESWGWPQFSGIDTGDINSRGSVPETVESKLGDLPFSKPREFPWNTTGYFNDPNRQDAYSQQWHVEVQREMARNLMVAVAYVGSQNGRLEYAGNAAASPVPGYEGTRKLSAAEVNALRPWPHITGTFTYEDDIGYSNFHSLQGKLQRRFSNGISTLLSYTWEKSLDTSSGWFNAERGVGNSIVQNYHDVDSNKGLSGYDVPHLLTWATVLELPFGPGKRFLNEGPASAIFGDWQLNWFMLARSGQPATIYMSGDIANIGSGGTYMRPDLVADPNISDPSAAAWFNTGAFATPVRSFGNSGRSQVRVDNVVNVDFGLQRNVRIAEGKQLEFKVEAFNIFNHMDLGNPETRLGNSNFGKITSISHSPRQLQFGIRFTY